MGSEMCIRDSAHSSQGGTLLGEESLGDFLVLGGQRGRGPSLPLLKGEEVGDLFLGRFHVVHGLVLEAGRKDEVRDGSDGQDKEKDGCGEEKNHATEKSPSCSHSVLPGTERYIKIKNNLVYFNIERGKKFNRQQNGRTSSLILKRDSER